MKQSIHMKSEARDMIIIAMEFHRKELDGLGQKLFDIAYNKMNRPETIFKLDGMEMIYVAQSLNKYRKHLSSLHKHHEAERYKYLAAQMEKIRICFQMANGPKIEKSS